MTAGSESPCFAASHEVGGLVPAGTEEVKAAFMTGPEDLRDGAIRRRLIPSSGVCEANTAKRPDPTDVRPGVSSLAGRPDAHIHRFPIHPISG
jgi:hypothetical protein